jgi:2-polyprenyl-3-methyl-5-hydroxy-6-metoxy-1,4-benzoquinol methylase
VNAEAEIQSGDRFSFGANWTRFLAVLDETRIADATESLRSMLSVDDLCGRRFLDIGCGSGLFSLAARRLGARVHSFDFDLQSVACAQELKRRYFPEDGSWSVESGSVLDRNYIEALGQFDVVYSWGVLHHTGSMWVALENAISRVSPAGGTLFIAIYNDQGWKSRAWWFVKSFYNRLPRPLKSPFASCMFALAHLLVIIKYSLRLKPMVALSPLLSDRRERGMSARFDAIDWIGGFPYEFATFDTLANFLEARGFLLTNGRRDTSQGCNELVVRRANEFDKCAE